jgi:hypothetical protein
MAVTCARCGTQNPDGNQFCQACGTPLAVAATALPVAPAAGAALPGPPSPPPGAYQSPYYAPSAVGPQPQVHRTPWVLIISAIVVLVVIMAGCGTAIALLSSKTTGNQGNSLLPSPSPAGTPSPTATPPTTTTGGGTASNKGETFIVPSGWTVESKDDESITITNPNGDGSVTIGSGASSPAQSAQQNKDTIDKFFQGKYPDTKNCTGSKTITGSLNGASGIFWALCFTLSSGGQSIQAEAPMYAGANSDGSVYYVVLLVTSQSNAESFVRDAAPILQSIQWKLK